jgi:hypothetical protein
VKKGDLVKVRYKSISYATSSGYGQTAEDWKWGHVLDYRPDVLGGPSSYTSRGLFAQSFSDVRGEVLVLVIDDGSMSWWDEDNVLLVGRDSQGETDPNTME